eukprot:c18138_g1_i3.p1 GENE.c18138_g1_i3~~c18138_g1_i3.p1  ORF type:complete len:150 (-),score=25.43 c18138_g1_i3:198-647(-)
MFYVSVADMDHLSSLPSFVACTTESVFREKSHLWDIYLDGPNILIGSLRSGIPTGVFRVTAADKTRHRLLTQRMERERPDFRELLVMRYFWSLTDQLHQQLDAVATTSGVLYTSDLAAMGLGRQDKPFLQSFIRTHRLEVVVRNRYCFC